MKLTKIKESIDQRIGLNEKAAFLQEVARFNEYGNAIYRTDSLREAAKAVSHIVENAEKIALQETDDSFDEITVKRNMKSLKANNEQFMKTVNEVSKLQQRLESLYEEMGHTLARYYEIH